MGMNEASNTNRSSNVEIATKICRFIPSRREGRDCISILSKLQPPSPKIF